MDKAKLIRRFENLARLAAPNSGATDGERTAALLRMKEMQRRHPDLFEPEEETTLIPRIKITKSVSAGFITIEPTEEEINLMGMLTNQSGVTIPKTTPQSVVLTMIQMHMRIVLTQPEIDMILKELK